MSNKKDEAMHALNVLMGKYPRVEIHTWEWWSMVMNSGGQVVTDDELMFIKLKYGDEFSAVKVNEVMADRY